jgi:ferredoxin-NADP reductase
VSLSETEKLKVRVHAVRYEADSVFSFELRRLDEAPLPVFTAGSHINVVLPNGLSRSYSLVSPEGDTDRYVIAVNRDSESRGGSKFICENVHAGAVLEISTPANTFSLNESAPLSVFIAGGIGITPLLCMIRRLEKLERDWHLYYATRTRKQMAFRGDLAVLNGEERDRITFIFDREPGNKMLDIAAVTAGRPAGTHFYCCGPNGMLRAFEDATRTLPSDVIHVEYFSSDTPKAKGGFEVVLSRTKKNIWVKPDQTILGALTENGVTVSSSCLEGVCGTCETVVLEGVPDHRDHVLSARERASNKKMMICCSGSIGERLVLDL